jgi:hypothetical protein
LLVSIASTLSSLLWTLVLLQLLFYVFAAQFKIVTTCHDDAGVKTRVTESGKCGKHFCFTEAYSIILAGTPISYSLQGKALDPAWAVFGPKMCRQLVTFFRDFQGKSCSGWFCR